VVATGSAEGAAIWDVTTRALRWSVAGAFHRGMAAAPPGSVALLVGWTEERVHMWRPGHDPALTTLPVTWEPGRQPITCATVLRSGTGSLLVAVAAGGRVTLWDATTDELLDIIEPKDTVNLQLATLCPPGGEDTLLVTTGLSYRTAVVWRPSTGARPWPLGEVPLCAASWTGAHGSFLVLGYLDGSVGIWHPDMPDTMRPVGTMSFTIQDIVVGPAGSPNPIVIAIDRVGAAKSWTVADLAPGPVISARQAHCADIGELSGGQPYLALGGNSGADIWRLDATDTAERGLHDSDALRLIRLPEPESLVLTAGEDGAVRVWDEADGTVRTLAVPTGALNDIVCWRDGSTPVVAVTAVDRLLLFDAVTGAVHGNHRIPAGPHRMAPLVTGDGVVVAAAARTRLYFLSPDAPTPWFFDLPMCYPGVTTEQTTTQRSITALTWVACPGQAPELMVATAGGMALALRLGDRAVEEVRGLTNDMGVIITAHVVAEPDQPPVVVLGSLDGQLRVVDVATASVIQDLTRDDARIAGATTVRRRSGELVLVTTHCDRDVRHVTGLRIWDLSSGTQQHGITRPGGTGDSFIGSPKAGQTAAGTPYVGYLVEDGVEMTFLDDVPRQVHLPLPVTANDLYVSSHTLYVAGGGGYLALRVNEHSVDSPNRVSHTAKEGVAGGTPVQGHHLGPR
jgi:WD40 repeat protein